MKKLIIYGMASKKNVAILDVDEHLNISLLDFLTRHNITIASSCFGAGSCKKCVVNKDLLSCQIKLQLLTMENEWTLVEVAYL